MSQQPLSTPPLEFIHQKRGLFLLILILMSTTGLVGSDVYLPVLPEIGTNLHRDAHAIQLTLSIYLLGLSLGQLFLGPLTDRFGRKKPLLVGMILYCISSVLCVFCHDYSLFMFLRFTQAFGACSGLIIGRAIVGDLFDAKQAGKVFSTVFPFVGMSPAISPMIGGFIGYYFGWPATFVFISLFSFALVVLISSYLPETMDEDKKQSLHLIKTLSAYPTLLLDKRFLAYASAPCFAYIAYFAYMTQSPFILHTMDFGERAIGLFYFSLAISYVAGNLTGKKMLNHFELPDVLHSGFWAFNLGGGVLLLSGLLHLPLWIVIAGISILTFGNGFLIPLGTAGVISSFQKSTGYASGLLGFLQVGSAAISSSVIGIISQNTFEKLSIFIFSNTVIGFIIFLTCYKKEK